MGILLRVQCTLVTQIIKRCSLFLRQHPGPGDNSVEMGLMRKISVALLSIVTHSDGTWTPACSNQIFSCLWHEKQNLRADETLLPYFLPISLTKEMLMHGWQILRIRSGCLFVLFKEMGILHGTSSYVKKKQSFMEW